MKAACSQCSQHIEIDDAELAGLSGGAVIDCPACGASITIQAPAPAPAARPVAPPLGFVKPPPRKVEKIVAVRPAALAPAKQISRNLRILGTVALLVLGGLAIFIASRKGGDTYNSKRNIIDEIIHNKFFTDLIAAGVTTEKTLLESIGDIRPYGIGFIAVSKEKLTAAQTPELAKRTGAEVLALDAPETASRQPLIEWLADFSADSLGSTVWVMEGGEVKVIDSPDVNRVTTMDRPRKVFLSWRPPLPPHPVIDVTKFQPVPTDNRTMYVEIVSIAPPVILSPANEISLQTTPGQKFKMELTVRYRTPEPAKLASNLLLEEANILPPEFIAELSANHNTTWHFDTESRQGYKSVDGEGEISFDLTGYAPKTGGDYKFKLNLGLFDKVTWNTKVLNLYEVTLTAK